MSTQELPRWDWSDVFPGLDSSEFHRAWQDLEQKIAALEELFERYRIGRAADTASAELFPRCISEINEMLEIFTPVRAVLSWLVDTQSKKRGERKRPRDLPSGGK